MAEKQVKSRKRVLNHGEVFTAEREVKAMCDLVKQETERIESRFLEPACGNGNFLAEILRRKLATVKKRYRKCSFDYERYSVLAVSSLYGVDILEDNSRECRERLFNIWETEYRKTIKSEPDEKCCNAVKWIIEKNILCGDALTMLKNDGDPIIFSEWSMIMGNRIKRKDYRLDVLLNENSDNSMYEHHDQLSLFSDTSSCVDYWEIDKITQKPIPKPIKEYPLIDYKEVQNYE